MRWKLKNKASCQNNLEVIAGKDVPRNRPILYSRYFHTNKHFHLSNNTRGYLA